jgi:hypothetical protein
MTSPGFLWYKITTENFKSSIFLNKRSLNYWRPDAKTELPTDRAVHMFMILPRFSLLQDDQFNSKFPNAIRNFIQIPPNFLCTAGVQNLQYSTRFLHLRLSDLSCYRIHYIIRLCQTNLSKRKQVNNKTNHFSQPTEWNMLRVSSQSLALAPTLILKRFNVVKFPTWNGRVNYCTFCSHLSYISKVVLRNTLQVQLTHDSRHS